MNSPKGLSTSGSALSDCLKDVPPVAHATARGSAPGSEAARAPAEIGRDRLPKGDNREVKPAPR